MADTDVTPRVSERSLLRRDRDFARLWLGESVSAVGSQITLLAVPLVAVQLLEATPGQMGILGALGTVPYLLFAVVAGVWVDRSRKRPLLIGAHLGEAVLLLLIPALALLDVLRLGHLFAIAFGLGIGKVLFEVAYQSYLPLVRRDDLVQANSRLSASTSVAEIGGPGLGGLLVSAVTAPIAVAVDAVSFRVSAVALSRIRRPEPEPAPAEPGRRLRAEVAEGFRETFRNRYLLAFAGEAATYNVAWSAMNALLVLWAVRELGLSPATLGLLLSVGSVGALLGALLTERLARRIGVGRAMWTSAVVSNVGVLLIPAAGGPPALVLGVLGTAFFLQGLGITGTNVHTYAIRQAVTPVAMLGRSSAAYRVLTYGFVPLGALLGVCSARPSGCDRRCWSARCCCSRPGAGCSSRRPAPCGRCPPPRSPPGDRPRRGPRGAGRVLDDVATDPRYAHTAALHVRVEGRVVVDEHLRGPRANDIYSVTKSILATVLARLAAQQRGPDLDTPVSAVLPALRDTPAARCTWRHLLTMTRGAETGGPWDIDEVTALPGGQVAHIAAAPQLDPPGTRFRYDNGATHLLSAAVGELIGEPVAAYAARELFGPLGIEEPPGSPTRTASRSASATCG